MKIRKSTLEIFIIFLGNVLIVLSCPKTESKSIQKGTLNNIRLTSSKGDQIAASTNEFKNITVNKIVGYNLNGRIKTFS